MFTNSTRFVTSSEIEAGHVVVSSKIDKRAKEILRLLLHHGKTSVDELTVLLKMSPASARRDLVRLEERGLVHRTHGGAMLADQAVYEPFRFDAAFGSAKSGLQKRSSVSRRQRPGWYRRMRPSALPQGRRQPGWLSTFATATIFTLLPTPSTLPWN